MKKVNQGGNLLVRQSIPEGRHHLSAIVDLGMCLLRIHVLRHISKRRRLLRAKTYRSMALRASRSGEQCGPFSDTFARTGSRLQRHQKSHAQQ